jgi:glyoxylase-like metal-dependent hydrolase (beta-lactamase superfamily II)
MQVIPLSEGSFTIAQDKVFVPFNPQIHNLADRPRGSLLVEVQPFVIKTSKDILLLDTGLGFSLTSGHLQIHENLLANGINPMDITKVLLSHLHKDHSGGISKEDTILGQRYISFPNATYYVSQNELAFGLAKGAPSFTPKEFDILQHINNVQLLPTQGVIDDYISFFTTGGHSPHHIAFKIQENNRTLFFGGDEAPQYNQMRSKFIAKYDYDGKRAMELRQQWLQQGHEENWEFLFYHDIAKPVVASSSI